MLSLDDAVIGDVEARLIRAKSPPLNLAGVSDGRRHENGGRGTLRGRSW